MTLIGSLNRQPPENGDRHGVGHFAPNASRGGLNFNRAQRERVISDGALLFTNGIGA